MHKSQATTNVIDWTFLNVTEGDEAYDPTETTDDPEEEEAKNEDAEAMETQDEAQQPDESENEPAPVETETANGVEPEPVAAPAVNAAVAEEGNCLNNLRLLLRLQCF